MGATRQDRFFSGQLARTLARTGCAIALLGLLALQPALAKRFALVVGNAAYSVKPLKNAGNDAQDIAATLSAIGFETTVVVNADRVTMLKAISAFGDKVSKDDETVFYFGGHGVQVNGQNYLIPVRAQIDYTEDVPVEGVNVEHVIKTLESTQNTVNIVILDACRNNPYTSRKKDRDLGGSRGLQRVTGPVGTMVVFSTAPGDVAGDGEGRNGIFTSALLQNIKTPDLTIQQMLTRVRNQVVKATNGQQVPWESSALTGDFYFVGRGAAQQVAGSEEETLWQLAAARNKVALYRTYLDEYPNGAHAAAAKAALQRSLGADTARTTVAEADRLYFEKNDYRGAFALYTQAAQMGDPSAMASLAKLWAMGRGTDRGADEAVAKQWRDKALPTITSLANSGHAFSQYQLATLYYHFGAAKDHAVSAHWYRKAADAGNVAAINNLGAMYLSGEGVAKDPAESARLYRKAADAGYAPAETNLAGMYRTGLGVQKDVDRALRLLRKSADAGYTEAYRALGDMYLGGEGVPQNDTEAMRLYRLAADAGDAEGQYSLGWSYANGKGVAQDYGEAMRWWRKATEAGSSTAQASLGTLYANGNGVARDDERAVQLFRQSADAGNAMGQRLLGVMYVNGRGVKQDVEEAVRWYRKAAEAGDLTAQIYLGTAHELGQGTAKNDGEAVKWYRKASEAGDARGARSLGVMYANGLGVAKDEAEAVRLFRKAAEADDVRGQLNLGVMYANGTGVTQDQAEAVRWYRKAADHGDTTAQRYLARMYEDGKGVSPDPAEAVRWYRKSADAGDVIAQGHVGWMYENGKGVRQDHAEAARWYRKAADGGNATAQGNLADLYENGRGVARDMNEAVRLYKLAARGGYQYAKDRLAALGYKEQ